MASTSPLPIDGQDFAGEDFDEFADGESVERVDLVGVLGIAHGLSDEAHIFEPAGNNVFSYDNADCGSHFALRGDLSSRDLRDLDFCASDQKQILRSAYPTVDYVVCGAPSLLRSG